MKIPGNIITLLIGIIITLLSLWFSQHNGLLPQIASAEAPQIDQLFNAMLAISIGLCLVIGGALIYSLLAFRQKPGDNTDAVPVHGNVPLEILWTAIPSAIVLWLAIYSFDIYKAVDSGAYVASLHESHHATEQVVASQERIQPGVALAATLPETELAQTNLPATAAGLEPGSEQVKPDTVGISGNENPSAPSQDTATRTVRKALPQREELTAPRIGPTTLEAATPADLEVNVTGLQYAWIFTYPDSNIVSGELHLPLNRSVKLNISANDVIHAFWVPQFRLKQDAIPGQQTRMRFTPTAVGEYPVICAELCGAYHSAMKTRVIVQSPQEYAAWIQSQVALAESGSVVATSQ